MTDKFHDICTKMNSNKSNVKKFIQMIGLSQKITDIEYNFAHNYNPLLILLEAYPFLGHVKSNLNQSIKDEFFTTVESEKDFSLIWMEANGILRFSFENMLVKLIEEKLLNDIESDNQQIDWTHIFCKENDSKFRAIVDEASISLKRDMATAIMLYDDPDYNASSKFKSSKALAILNNFFLEDHLFTNFIHYSPDVKLGKSLNILKQYNRMIADVILKASTSLIEAIETAA